MRGISSHDRRMPKPSQSPPKLAQIVEKRRWTRSDAAHVVTAWRASGLSRAAFATRHNLDPQRIARWAAELPERPAFAEVIVVTDPKPSPPAGMIAVELGRARVVVEGDVDDDQLARVLRIVEAVC